MILSKKINYVIDLYAALVRKSKKYFAFCTLIRNFAV